MSDGLRIRNVTSESINIELVERYEPPRPSAIATLSRNITCLFSNTSTPEDSQYWTESKTDVSIAPFTLANTDISPLNPAPASLIRLSLSISSHTYSITLSAAQHSTPLAPLSSGPVYSTVYHGPSHTLAIFPPLELQRWMSPLSSSLPLSALSLPGTHNSPTCHRALPSVRCQSVPVTTQLANGVRFLDIRVQPVSPTSDTLVLVHGVFPISLTGGMHFRPLLDELHRFLHANPSETIILSLKREGLPGCTDAHLASILATHYKDAFLCPTTVPTLGQARGKIVLMARFAPPTGLDAAAWPFNTPSHATPVLHVQDFCDVVAPPLVTDKLGHVVTHMAGAGERRYAADGGGDGRLWINFLTGSNFWHPACWPERIARIVNEEVKRYLCCEHGKDSEGDWGTGVVVCDWVGEGGDWDLVRCVVGMNARVAARLPRED